MFPVHRQQAQIDPVLLPIIKAGGDGTQIVEDDEYLRPYSMFFRARFSSIKLLLLEIDDKEEGLLNFSKGYEKFGFNLVSSSPGLPQNTVVFREYAPKANSLYLIGDFNGWDRRSHPLKKEEFGRWSITLPPQADGSFAIPHNSKVKLDVELANGRHEDRIPAWISRVELDLQNPSNWNGVFWQPPDSQNYRWQYPFPKITEGHRSPRIYEAHIGMSSEEQKVSTYEEFRLQVLPHIDDMGYNCLQLMGIMEHSYYASFGYQVTNFFACSSRYGTPEDLKRLIDDAHNRGISVFLDVVHSHASKNVGDGLNLFDGTDYCYFHGGDRGNHPVWDSRLFDYHNWETLRFLLSNIRWWLDEYHFDGFRFDGVTSMIYLHHGIGESFSNGYADYFGGQVDNDACRYFAVANYLIHQLRPDAITIAEDVSGMPGMCRPIQDGGLGFDYRLSMGIPDLWIKILRDFKRDEDWNMGHIIYVLTDRRYKEPTIGYAESHDQSLVGDKTLAFWLMDKEMYDCMSILQPASSIIDRGIALHKMIRMITMALGGEAYLNFMGNEFGHPEWIDFPREGNGNSHYYARRQWNLMKDPLLRYQHLSNFDRAMNQLEEKFHFLRSPQAYVLLKHESDKVITFERGGLFWVFNFSYKSFPDYSLGVSRPGKYKIALDSDDVTFGGHARVDHHTEFFTQPIAHHNMPQCLMAYLPSRTVLILYFCD